MTQSVPFYSSLFACLYDHKDPSVPTWTHHSIFRCVEYRDVTRKLLSEPVIHDFAIIWDEDHDTRVIAAVERIYMAGLMAPVQFIGEHKGTLTAIIAAKAWFGMEEDAESYARRLYSAVNEGAQDQWPVVLGMFDRSDRDLRDAHQTELKQIIGVDPQVEHTFLLNLDAVWKLGTKEWSA